jgi:hypothetical protein
MKTIRLTNIDSEIFKNAFLNFKKFVSSDFEFNFDNFELSTRLDDFDKWHLVTLAQFYGGDLFRKKTEIEFIRLQSVDIPFTIEYDLPKITFKTAWNDNIEFNPAYLNSADFFLTDNLVKILSNNSKQLLLDNEIDLNLGQSVCLSSIKYAYFIVDKTLVLILTERYNAKVTHLFNIKWNEI